MALSRAARLTLWVALVVAVFVYLIVVELGINAGRIHHGVEVRGGITVGGLTPAEAEARLTKRAEAMLGEPVVFGTEALGPFTICPDVEAAIEIVEAAIEKGAPQSSECAEESLPSAGWRPGVSRTVDEAMSVGRSDGPFAALAERIDAWWGGAKVAWKGRPNPKMLDELVDRIERRAVERGMELDRERFKKKIWRALNSWPRHDFYRLPTT
jgi:hypothetical protein